MVEDSVDTRSQKKKRVNSKNTVENYSHVAHVPNDSHGMCRLRAMEACLTFIYARILYILNIRNVTPLTHLEHTECVRVWEQRNYCWCDDRLQICGLTSSPLHGQTQKYTTTFH
ncbi:hypothetical protein, unlikely [Trypanosoma brucei gambiense DAL972]|uniref:Uncharacterized protein n=1 Tax=Trypanosoma brucei gambiense (strain MHOM/CI/86/DAL972) TaxID=679716 RepID=D0A3M9_TRYB9|nr:hypothetical protein, unlikely [Trypanosoma brucei gambiense DAL972]CBH15873.1 hypothetical protein, unlikely [Trypanosoma brucei gambiense DAL972]|eukprot:XP_011778137.1 hypothetical protein, unlikely [Trypanosoma brucei gambiense DAL972]